MRTSFSQHIGIGGKREQRGVVVNEYLQSVSNAAVYAGGDAAAGGPPLTPKADHNVAVLTSNVLGGNRRTVNYDGLASAVFTIPPLASAGLTRGGRPCRWPEISQDVAGHVRLVQHTPRRRDRVRVQGPCRG